MNKEVKEIVRDMKRRGWWVVPTSKRHIKMRHDKYGTQVIPHSPSDHHWRKNLLNQIKKKEQLCQSTHGQ